MIKYNITVCAAVHRERPEKREIPYDVYLV